MLYKNLMQNIPIIMFGIYSGFSGQIIYETVMTQTFNILFTSWPIIIYATMDQEYTKEILLENPQLYKKGLKGKDFSVWIYF